ncbi:sugar phosphate isomerase/epimerase family protein [Jannaschia marina]|uniref:sugar phosphate isomerase/epimerase family protein n=1 Tax=Jannaschia marina TaxID=2741674 RepID=UPI0015CC369E|nr:sugar phosphate isomerase/epimerase family protein [Jannaschia marina]
MLGLGSYTFRWSIGHKGLLPPEPLTHLDLIGIAAEHGLGLVQFADNIPVDTLDAAGLAMLRAEADAKGVSIEIGTQAFDADQVGRYLGIAKMLDAELLRVALDAPDAAVPVPELATAFRDLLPQARAAGVRIAIENHFNYPSPRLVALLEEIDDPSVGVCLDVANSICAGEWPAETVARLAPHTINLHLKDYDILPDPYGVGFAIEGVPLGQGRTDCRAVLEALPRDREVNVILEHWLPRRDDMAAARAAEHDWLRQGVAHARGTLGL